MEAAAAHLFWVNDVQRTSALPLDFYLNFLLYLCFNLCQLDALNVFFWVSQIMSFFGHFCKGSDKCRMARCVLNFIYSYCKDLRFQCDIVFSFVLQVQVRWSELHFSVDFCPTHCFHKSIVLWEINLVFYLTNLLALPIFFHLHVFANLFCRKKYLPTIIFHIPHVLV